MERAGLIWRGDYDVVIPEALGLVAPVLIGHSMGGMTAAVATNKNLSIDTCEPFTTLVDYKKCPKGWERLDLNQRRLTPEDLQSSAIGRYATLPKSAGERT